VDITFGWLSGVYCRNQGRFYVGHETPVSGKYPLIYLVPRSTNLNFAEGVEVFADAKMTMALLDHIIHHCDILEIVKDGGAFYCPY